MEKKIVSMTLAKIGFLLLDVQSTERAIKLCAKVALPKLDQILTGLGDRIQNGEYDRKTIGQMLGQLRERATFQTDFEAILDRFLRNRNLLAHDLANIPGWSLKKEEGLKAANEFLDELTDDSRTVRSVFVGIINSWRIQSGHDVDEEEFANLKIPESLQKPILKDVYATKNA